MEKDVQELCDPCDYLDKTTGQCKALFDPQKQALETGQCSDHSLDGIKSIRTLKGSIPTQIINPQINNQFTNRLSKG